MATTKEAVDALVTEGTDAGSSTFLCPVCGASVVNKGSLKRHVLDRHFDDGGRFICPRCMKDTYKTKRRLYDHVRACHKDMLLSKEEAEACKVYP